LIASQSDGFNWISVGDMMDALELLYQGKAKSAYLTEDPELLILKFRDDTSAFDGEIIEQLSREGCD
jgi:phosphoribosylaminoimidazole-succinocarboxamide synthase